MTAVAQHQPEVFLRDLERASDETENKLFIALVTYLAVRSDEDEPDSDDSALALILRGPVTAFALAVADLMRRHPAGATVVDSEDLRSRVGESAVAAATAAFAEAVATDESMLAGEGDDRRTVRLRHIAESVTTAVRSQVQMMVAREMDFAVKTWRTRLDDRVRHAHRRLEGRTVPLNGVFVTIGGVLRWPGDRRAPISLWINCRCKLSFGMR